MSKAQRERGARYERELANQLTNELGIAVKRNIGQARDSGDDITVGKFRIEAKRRAKISVYEFMEQAQKSEGTPVVMMRADGKETLVVMRLNDFIPMLREVL